MEGVDEFTELWRHPSLKMVFSSFAFAYGCMRNFLLPLTKFRFGWISIIKHFDIWAVVEFQLVELSLLTPEVRGSNLVIGKLYITHIVSTVLKRRK